MDPYKYTQQILEQYGPGGKAYEGGQQLPAPGDPSKVFVSHGHCEKAREDVSTFLTSIGLEPIILAEQPGGGRAIIEKFEDYSKVGFAVILLTGDDIGRDKSKPESDNLPRARQNVIMELGYFIAKLGRGRVYVLIQEGVEIPSNISGTIPIPFADDGKWKTSLAKEMDYGGLYFDKNAIT